NRDSDLSHKTDMFGGLKQRSDREGSQGMIPSPLKRQSNGNRKKRFELDFAPRLKTLMDVRNTGHFKLARIGKSIIEKLRGKPDPRLPGCLREKIRYQAGSRPASPAAASCS